MSRLPSSQYQYKSLRHREVRLLNLLPGSPDEPVFCVLFHIDISGSYSGFTALSYTWGDPTDEYHMIYLHDQMQDLEGLQYIRSAQFRVRDNLYQALLALRLEYQPRTLWIDAICINQCDLDEKGAQLPLMRDIYTKCVGVVLWLGSAADDSDFVMDYLRRSEHFLQHCIQQSIDPKSPELTSNRFLRGFLKLVQRPWFNRVWIIQELVLNPQTPWVYCGLGEPVRWDMICFLESRLSILNEFPPHSPEPKIRKENRLEEVAERAHIATEYFNVSRTSTIFWLHVARSKVRNIQAGTWHGLTIEQCLLLGRRSQASDPKDKVYGMLGLLNDEDSKAISVEYRKSVAQIYQEVTELILLENLYMETYFQFPCPVEINSNPHALPSWVPDFSYWSPSICCSPPQCYIDELRKNIGGDCVPLARVDGCLLKCSSVVLGEIATTHKSPLRHLNDLWRKEESKNVKQEGNVQAQSEEISSAWNHISPHQESWMKRREAMVKVMNEIEEACRSNTMVAAGGSQMNAISASTTADLHGWVSKPIWQSLIRGDRDVGILSDYDFQEAFSQFVGGPTPPTCASDIDKNEAPYLELELPLSAIWHDGQVFFITNTGIWGTSCSQARKGDKLALMFGPWYLPMIVRPFRDMHQIVGPVIMDRDIHSQVIEPLKHRTVEQYWSSTLVIC